MNYGTRNFLKGVGLVLFALAVLLASTGQTQAADYTPKQQASINVAAAYAKDTLKMTTFKVMSVRQDGTLVNAECSRTVTALGRTTTTKYAVSFSIAATVPPRGQVGQLYVSSVTSNTIK